MKLEHRSSKRCFFKELGFKLHDTMIYQKKVQGRAVQIRHIGRHLSICSSL